MSRTVTLIIHGTFAADATWWRLGDEGDLTFADRLENELSRRGLAGTVWKPVLDEGFTYSSFTWSGRNRHRDRISGARRLRSSINRFAQRIAATPAEPLVVNLVAHSHGGNVVLEALRNLGPTVRVGRVVLLGTPLVTARPAFRIARFITSTLLLGIFFMIVAYVVMQLIAILFTCLTSTCHLLNSGPEYGPRGEITSQGWSGAALTALAVPMIFAYGWFFLAFNVLLDAVWRLLYWLVYPIEWLRGRSRSLVYGPSSSKLARVLGKAPILLLTSRNDEADLFLQIGSAPARLYQEYVKTTFSRFGRAIEASLLRPFVLSALLEPVEMLLEVVWLGVPLWRAMVLDYEVAPLEKRQYYPASLLVRQKVDIRPGAVSTLARLDARETSGGTTQSRIEQQPGLRLSLEEVTKEIRKQIQLRHSAYYENSAVLERVAAFLTGDEGGPVRSDV